MFKDLAPATVCLDKDPGQIRKHSGNLLVPFLSSFRFTPRPYSAVKTEGARGDIVLRLFAVPSSVDG